MSSYLGCRILLALVAVKGFWLKIMDIENFFQNDAIELVQHLFTNAPHCILSGSRRDILTLKLSKPMMEDLFCRLSTMASKVATI